MQGPKNRAGVVVAVLFAGLLVAGATALGFGESTRRGLPVWLLCVVGVACFLGVAVESWRKPRRTPGQDGPAMTKGAKVVLGGYLVWTLVPLLAIAVGLVVSALR